MNVANHENGNLAVGQVQMQIQPLPGRDAIEEILARREVQRVVDPQDQIAIRSRGQRRRRAATRKNVPITVGVEFAGQRQDDRREGLGDHELLHVPGYRYALAAANLFAGFDAPADLHVLLDLHPSVGDHVPVDRGGLVDRDPAIGIDPFHLGVLAHRHRAIAGHQPPGHDDVLMYGHPVLPEHGHLSEDVPRVAVQHDPRLHRLQVGPILFRRQVLVSVLHDDLASCPQVIPRQNSRKATPAAAADFPPKRCNIT